MRTYQLSKHSGRGTIGLAQNSVFIRTSLRQSGNQKPKQGSASDSLTTALAFAAWHQVLQPHTLPFRRLQQVSLVTCVENLQRMFGACITCLKVRMMYYSAVEASMCARGLAEGIPAAGPKLKSALFVYWQAPSVAMVQDRSQQYIFR